MLTLNISPSGFSTHEGCETDYFISYVLGHRGPGNIAADKGTIVHKVMEILAKNKLALQNGDKSFKDELSPRAIRVKKEYKKDDVDKLIKKCWDHYVAKLPHDPDPDNPKVDHWYNPEKNHWGEVVKWSWDFLEWGDGMFDPRTLDIIRPEFFFAHEFSEPWADLNFKFKGNPIKGKFAVRGIIDLIFCHERYPDGSPKVIEIVDWKTGQRKDWNTGKVKDERALYKDPQLRLYHYVLNQMYPDVEHIAVTVFYVKHGGPFTIPFTKRDLDLTRDMVRYKYEYLKEVRSPKKISADRGWKCKKWCYFGMNSFEGTDIPVKKNRWGEDMVMCEQVHHEIKTQGLDWVTDNMCTEHQQKKLYKLGGIEE